MTGSDEDGTYSSIKTMMKPAVLLPFCELPEEREGQMTG